MNFDSIHRLIEETHIFRMQPSSAKTPRDLAAPAPAARGPCDACWPRSGLQAPAAPRVWAHARPTDEWDICEELRLRELEEAKARAAQMEKTMRWWSDCTANWREKWSKVRAERNSAREEGRQLRVKLEMAVKELSALKKRQSSPEAQEARAAQDQRRPSFMAVPCAQRDRFRGGLRTCTGECLVTGDSPRKDNTGGMEEGLVLDPLGPIKDMKLGLGCPDSFDSAGSENGATGPARRRPGGQLPLESEAPELSALQVHWEEFQKILRKERELRSSLEKEVERLESAVSLWKRKYEELKESTSRSRKEFNALHGQHKNEMAELPEDVKERSKPQESQDRAIHELRAELNDALNQIRKLQRSLDDQKEANGNLETELGHLQNR